MGFGDYASAVNFRDVVASIAQSEIDKARPKPRRATVVSIDRANKTAQVIYVGETDPVTVSMPTVQPASAGQTVIIDGTSTNRAITAIVGDQYTFPPGSVMMFGANNPPSGWLVCNGQAVSRTLFPDLFQAIGTTYGYGDFSTTFNVPDFGAKFPYGGTPGYGGGDATVDHKHKLTPHNHTYTVGTHAHPLFPHTHDMSTGYALIEVWSGVVRAASYAGGPTFSANVSSTATDYTTGSFTAGAYTPLAGETANQPNEVTATATIPQALTDPNAEAYTSVETITILPPFMGIAFIIKT